MQKQTIQLRPRAILGPNLEKGEGGGTEKSPWKKVYLWSLPNDPIHKSKLVLGIWGVPPCKKKNNSGQGTGSEKGVDTAFPGSETLVQNEDTRLNRSSEEKGGVPEGANKFKKPPCAPQPRRGLGLAIFGKNDTLRSGGEGGRCRKEQ